VAASRSYLVSAGPRGESVLVHDASEQLQVRGLGAGDRVGHPGVVEQVLTGDVGGGGVAPPRCCKPRVMDMGMPLVQAPLLARHCGWRTMMRDTFTLWDSSLMRSSLTVWISQE